MERNRMRFLLEFFKIRTLILIFPAFIFMEIGMFPYAVLNKWALTKLKVYLWFFNPKNIVQVIKKRKEVQKLRKISDKELIEGMVGVIDFQQINNPVLKYIANPIFNLYWNIVKKIIICTFLIVFLVVLIQIYIKFLLKQYIDLMNNKLQSGIILKLVFIIPFIFAPLRYALYSLHFKNSYNLNERDELTAIAGGTQHESLYC
jgi:hypothetical protein